MHPLWLVLILVALAAGFLLGFRLQRRRTEKDPESERERLVEEAKQEAAAIREAAEAEARDKALREKEKASQELQAALHEVRNQERELGKRETDLRTQLQKVSAQEQDLGRREKSVKQKEQAAESSAKTAEKALGDAKKNLEQVAGMTQEQAKAALREQVVEEARAQAASEVRRIESETEEVCQERAKRIIVTAISRYAGEYISERTVAVVQLASDDLKGRIIGREGRNIRTLEAATGVDLIIDDTPEAVIISCFNPVRREVARLALSRLIADGRIHPSRIEEVVKRCEAEVDTLCKEAGEQATFDLGLHKVHPDIIRLLGSLRFRSSYAQNLLQHSVEVGFLAGVMASELGLNVKLARRAGLLHDIGKAVDHQIEGSHAEVGAQTAKKYSEQPKIVSAIGSHHGTPAPQTVLDFLVYAANDLSARRPGARREMLASLIKRVDELEKAAMSFAGVKQAYALQSGREVRVLVEPTKVSDDQALVLAREIARKMENELSYPGQIRVNVVRESRASDVAQ